MLSKIPIKSPADIELMRQACQATADILDAVGDIIKPGVRTEDINSFVHQMTLELGASPSPLNYKGFPKSVCTSINDVVCHGVPSPFVVLKEGDIINVDVTSFKSGFHGDSSRMYFVGGKEACSKEAVELVETTHHCLHIGIKEVAPGKRIGDIGAAIQDYIKEQGKGYGVVREYTGHGIGREFHEPPQVVHVGRRGSGEIMRPGMTFTIEPMINAGTRETDLSKIDGWTVRTKDGSLSAQWEHTVLVTEKGCEILTASKRFPAI
ncbi:MAG: type I methionyl aminopeptidase [Deltaproteobacteria bacterium]|nr:type I methionyl aminopeptidase [Deltaproteobacteria bacterium]